MANKMQRIFDLYQEEIQKLPSVSNWTSFLRSAAWQYKYSFEDQLLIYAQRPDATACATHKIWNKHLKRWINRGAKGIALLRENDQGHYLNYVFDISDTNSFYGNEVSLWQYRKEYFDEISETIENHFGEFGYSPTSINGVIECAAENVVADNMPDYVGILKDVIRDSLLEDYDDLNIDKRFQELAESSITYMALTRMVFNANDYITQEDFQNIFEFNTPETIVVLGTAISDMSEQVIRQMEGTVRAYERAKLPRNYKEFFAKEENPLYNESQEKTNEIQNNEISERTDENGSIDIHAGRRLSDAELDSSDTDGADREIRTDAAEVPETESQEFVRNDENQGDIDITSLGDRQDSEKASGYDSSSVGESRQSGRANESEQSN